MYDRIEVFKEYNEGIRRETILQSDYILYTYVTQDDLFMYFSGKDIFKIFLLGW